jgi:hypothetical protein
MAYNSQPLTAGYEGQLRGRHRLGETFETHAEYDKMKF